MLKVFSIARLRARGVTARLPGWLRALGYRLLGGAAFDAAMWREQYRLRLADSVAAPRRTDVTLGIITDAMYRYGFYELACHELGIPHVLIDITATDWKERVTDAGCDAFVVWPFVQTAAGKALYDERVGIMVDTLGLRVFPEVAALWLYESKIRTADWLDNHGVPQPVTRVFYDQTAAYDFAQNSPLPCVVKTDRGSESFGVRIVRTRRDARRLVNAAFGRGLRTSRMDRADRERGHIIFQEFIPDAREWRMARIGDSYFGHRKGRRGDFHSGSKQIEFDTPPRALLDLTRQVTDAGGFSAMSLDILETRDGEYRVIEMHAYFGCNSPHVMAVNGIPGRFVYDADTDDYQFEAGDFNRNQSCNLRLTTWLGTLESTGIDGHRRGAMANDAPDDAMVSR